MWNLQGSISSGSVQRSCGSDECRGVGQAGSWTWQCLWASWIVLVWKCECTEAWYFERPGMTIGEGPVSVQTEILWMKFSQREIESHHCVTWLKFPGKTGRPLVKVWPQLQWRLHPLQMPGLWDVYQWQWQVCWKASISLKIICMLQEGEQEKCNYLNFEGLEDHKWVPDLDVEFFILLKLGVSFICSVLWFICFEIKIKN